jgi:hypothetical protein
MTVCTDSAYHLQVATVCLRRFKNTDASLCGQALLNLKAQVQRLQRRNLAALRQDIRIHRGHVGVEVRIDRGQMGVEVRVDVRHRCVDIRGSRRYVCVDVRINCRNAGIGNWY